LKGFYTSKKGKLIPFIVIKSDTGVTIILKGVSEGLAQATSLNGTSINVTTKSFEDFKKNVLDKDKQWTNVKYIQLASIVPGTWRSDDDIVSSYEGGKPKHTHRKPTKRRRSRRVYRKTKKN
jgi:hypothetical protein